MPFRGSPLTSRTNREAPSIENREDGLELEHTGVQRAEERGKCHEVSAEIRGELRVHCDVLPEEVATRELAGASERLGHVSLGFVVSQ